MNALLDPNDRAMRLAVPEAEALGHAWLGELHILLGIAKTDGAARRALDSADATHARIVAAASELLGTSTTDPEGPQRPKWQFNPAAWTAIKWADGFATGRNEQLSEDHLLVAIAWDNLFFTAAVFRQLGVDRGSLVEALGAEGGSAPSDRPPPDPAR